MRTVSVLSAPVDLVQRLDDVPARLDLLVGRHRVLEVENITSAAERAAFSKTAASCPAPPARSDAGRGVRARELTVLKLRLPDEFLPDVTLRAARRASG